jgi:hypothetical protein
MKRALPVGGGRPPVGENDFSRQASRPLLLSVSALHFNRMVRFGIPEKAAVSQP